MCSIQSDPSNQSFIWPDKPVRRVVITFNVKFATPLQLHEVVTWNKKKDFCNSLWIKAKRLNVNMDDCLLPPDETVLKRIKKD